MIYKICPKCNKTKEHSEFTKNKDNKDGLAYYCRSCCSELCKQYWIKNKAKFIMPPIPGGFILVSSIPGFEHAEGICINKSGNIISIRKHGNKSTQWLPLKDKIDTKGYPCIGVRISGCLKYHRVHQIVAKEWVENPDNKPFINHKNGIKTDNRVENLEYCTASENIKHSYEKLGHPRMQGTKSPKAKLNDKKVREIKKLINEGKTMRAIASIFKTHHSIIQGIKSGKRWPHVNI